jgi:hypothetical protein
MAERTEDPTVVAADLTAHPMVDLTSHPMVDLTSHPMVGREAATDLTAHLMVGLPAVLIMAIGSAADRAGSTVIATSGIASGIAGIQTATTGRAGTFAALTGSQRDEVASGAVEPKRAEIAPRQREQLRPSRRQPGVGIRRMSHVGRP